MGYALRLSLAAALNPTLVAATTVMLLLPRPGRLMLGYWLGAMITSITLGLLIVFSLNGSSTVSTTKKTLSPIADLALATIFLALAAVLKTRRPKRLSTDRSKRNKNKKPPSSRRCAKEPPEPPS
jgi:Sap, sulfolipid-1-addressing protein